MAVAAGFAHTVVVAEDGTLLTWGAGRRGQLGKTIANATIAMVAAGACHTGIVTESGDLLMCGAGDNGRLGLGDENDRGTPTLVIRALFDGDAVLMVACGAYHTAALTVGGVVYTFGRGDSGQLGHGNDEEDQLAPRRVPAAAFSGQRVVMVAVGNAYTVALSEAGHVYTWGRGGYGQLGHNDEEDQRVPRQVEPGWFGGEKVVFVAAGRAHTVAVTARGWLYTWGRGACGQLGHGDTGNRLVPTLVGVGAFGQFGGSAVVMASCGAGHTLVVTHDGALWACGDGGDGQLGLDDEENRLVLERVGAEEFGGARVVAAAAGEHHSAAVTENGALWTCGAGNDGRLGHGDKEHRRVPTLLAGTGLGSQRIGRCRGLPAEHALAFAMGTHGRLGAASPVRCLAGEVGLLRMIAGWCRRLRWVRGAVGKEEGLVRLLGGWGG